MYLCTRWEKGWKIVMNCPVIPLQGLILARSKQHIHVHSCSALTGCVSTVRGSLHLTTRDNLFNLVRFLIGLIRLKFLSLPNPPKAASATRVFTPTAGMNANLTCPRTWEWGILARNQKLLVLTHKLIIENPKSRALLIPEVSSGTQRPKIQNRKGCC